LDRCGSGYDVDVHNLPPAFLAIAECDILAEQNVEMARRLRESGVPTHSVVYPGASHSFIEAMSMPGQRPGSGGRLGWPGALSLGGARPGPWPERDGKRPAASAQDARG
jgi:acetyl esterase/lipase